MGSRYEEARDKAVDWHVRGVVEALCGGKSTGEVHNLHGYRVGWRVRDYEWLKAEVEKRYGELAPGTEVAGVSIWDLPVVVDSGMPERCIDFVYPSGRRERFEVTGVEDNGYGSRGDES
jgi:hypothetical protein